MPNILHLIDTTGPGGAETLLLGLAEHFSRPPYESVAMIRGPGWVKNQLEERGIPVIVENSRGSVNFGYLRRLVQHLRARNIDLLHAHLPGANLYGSMAGRLHGIPVISTFHGSVDLGSKGRMDGIKRRIVRRYSFPVAVSEPLRQEVADALELRLEAVRLIPNGIDCRRFASAEHLELRGQYGLSRDAFLIGSLGNIRPAKDYGTGLRALQRLRAWGVDAHWFIAGQHRPTDRLLAELEAESKALGIEPYAHFIGFVEQPERFLAALDAFLLCSSSEGHPLSLMQAMAAGRPIVATRCGVEGVLDGGCLAWMAETGNPDGLAERLFEVTKGGDHAEQIRLAAQTAVFGQYDLDAVSQSYESLYGELLR